MLTAECMITAGFEVLLSNQSGSCQFYSACSFLY